MLHCGVQVLGLEGSLCATVSRSPGWQLHACVLDAWARRLALCPQRAQVSARRATVLRASRGQARSLGRAPMTAAPSESSRPPSRGASRRSNCRTVPSSLPATKWSAAGRASAGSRKAPQATNARQRQQTGELDMLLLLHNDAWHARPCHGEASNGGQSRQRRVRAGALLSRISSARTRPLRMNGRDAFRCRSMTRTCAAQRAAGHESATTLAPQHFSRTMRTSTSTRASHSGDKAHNTPPVTRVMVWQHSRRACRSDAQEMICELSHCGRNFTQYMLDVCPCERAPVSKAREALHCTSSLRGTVGQAQLQLSRPAPAPPHTRVVRQAAANFPSGRSRAQRNGRSGCALHRSAGASALRAACLA